MVEGAFKRGEGTNSRDGHGLGHPAAGLITNTEDLIQFLRWHFRAPEGEDNRLLSAETLTEMQRVRDPLPQQGPVLAAVSTFFANAFSLGGTGLGYFRDRKLVVHSGGIWGFRSELLMDNEARLGMVVLANASDAPLSLHEPASVLRQLYAMVAADEGPPARLKPPQEGSSLTAPITRAATTTATTGAAISRRAMGRFSWSI